jgi:hypothetical protein
MISANRLETERTHAMLEDITICLIRLPGILKRGIVELHNGREVTADIGGLRILPVEFRLHRALDLWEGEAMVAIVAIAWTIIAWNIALVCIGHILLQVALQALCGDTCLNGMFVEIEDGDIWFGQNEAGSLTKTAILESRIEGFKFGNTTRQIGVMGMITYHIS